MSAQDTQESPPADAESVGIVETQSATLFTDQPLTLASGQTLGPVTVAYEIYGQLNETRDNAVFVCHALTGDAHAAGFHAGEDQKPGWWDGLIGPGKGIDTDQYCVICANVLGGCQGTTGPGNINPNTGERYRLNFPFLTVSDIVAVHSELVRSLGVQRLCGAIGGSLGGMQVLEWTVRFPEQIASAIVVASGHRLAAQGIAFNAVGRRAIYADPGFHEGNYDPDRPPQYGLALARMIAHITYLSEDSIELKFGRRLQDSNQFAFNMLKETEFQIESYLHYQGKRFVQRFDANSYLYLTRAMDYFDLSEGFDSLADACRRATARFLVVSYDTDWLFPTSQSRELTTALLQVGRHVSFVERACSFGHDSFLIDVEPLAEVVSRFWPKPERRNDDEQHKPAETPLIMSVASRYQLPDPSVRLTDELIMKHIDQSSRVIDLGCGDGRLMDRLHQELRCDVLGVDVEQANAVSVIRRGLPVVVADMDYGLKDIPSGSFDFAVLSQTLQQVKQPKQLLKEMLRVARRALVVVPNFGYWRVRFEVVRRGRTPVTSNLPCEWHETPNRHFMSMYDFRELMESIGLTIVKESPIIRGRAVDRAWAANLRADSAFYLLEQSSSPPPATESA